MVSEAFVSSGTALGWLLVWSREQRAPELGQQQLSSLEQRPGRFQAVVAQLCHGEDLCSQDGFSRSWVVSVGHRTAANPSDSSAPAPSSPRQRPLLWSCSSASVPALQLLPGIATAKNTSCFNVWTPLPLLTFTCPTQARLDIGQVSITFLLCHCSKIRSSLSSGSKQGLTMYFQFFDVIWEKSTNSCLFLLSWMWLPYVCQGASGEEHPKVSEAFISPVCFRI